MDFGEKSAGVNNHNYRVLWRKNRVIFKFRKSTIASYFACYVLNFKVLTMYVLLFNGRQLGLSFANPKLIFGLIVIIA